MVELSNRVPAVKKSYHDYILRRNTELKVIFNKLIECGIFRSDIPDTISSGVVTQIFILGDHWLSFNAVTASVAAEDVPAAFKSLYITFFFHT